MDKNDKNKPAVTPDTESTTVEKVTNEQLEKATGGWWDDYGSGGGWGGYDVMMQIEYQGYY